jgi:WD40 repeat protein
VSAWRGLAAALCVALLLPLLGWAQAPPGHSPALFTAPQPVPDLAARVDDFAGRSYAHSAQFSPDGLLVASGHWDGSIRIHDALTGTEQARLSGHDGSFWLRAVRSVAWDPAGARLASAGDDGTVRLWDAAAGTELARLSGHDGPVSSVAWDPAGARLASAGADGTLRLWDVAAGTELARLSGHDGAVRSVAWDPAGARLASAGADSTVRLWDAAAGIELARLSGHDAWVRSVAWDPAGARLASAGEDGKVRLWDAAARTDLARLSGHDGSVRSVAWDPTGARLASAGHDGTVRLWDAAAGTELARLSGHDGWIQSVAWDPAGARLASAGDDGTVRLWDAAGGDLLGWFLTGGEQWIGCLRNTGGFRCRRNDDGSLVFRRPGTPRLEPLPLPRRAAPATLEAAPAADLQQPVAVPNGVLAEIRVQVRNPGTEPVYWIRLVPEQPTRDGFVLWPSPALAKLDAGAAETLVARVSFAPRDDPDRGHPSGAEARLDFTVQMDQGEPIPLRVAVRGQVPELAVAEGPSKSPEVRTLNLRLRNAGEQALRDARVRATLTGLAAPAERVQLDTVEVAEVPAGDSIPLAFALGDRVELGPDTRLTLTVDDTVWPVHRWTFRDLPIAILAPPAQLAALPAPALPLLALIAGLTALGLFYVREFTHPLTRRLAAEPAALAGLGLATLPRAKRLLSSTRRLKGLLAGTGIHRDWLERALAFDGQSAEAQVHWLAGRLAAQWQRREGLGDGARMARFDLTLPEDFPLNLVDGLCPVALPPADWGDEQVLDALRPVGERVCVLLGAGPEQRARLSRRCRSEGNWWVAPADAELSALLLSPQPLEALSRLIADYVKVARISPYQTGGGVQKEAVFFGRDQLLSHIQHREPANYLLVGGRQLGKSSLLLALQRRYAKDPAVDCRYASLGLDPIPQLALALGLPVDTGAQQVLQAVGDVPPGRRRLLLLDEADVFVARDAAGALGEAGGAPYACLNAFRSYSDAGRCHFILAGFWQLYRSASLEYHSPIKNFAETLTVGALEPDACRALIREPLAALNLRLAADALVERMVTATGRRANLIAILCNEMLKETRLATRTLGEADLERAMDSRALRSALDAWSELTTDQAAARLDRIICYALVEREDFSFAEVLDVLDGIGAGAVCAADIGVAAVRTADPTRAPASPEAIKASLTRLEIAFIIGRSDGRYFWQVPLWREQVQAEEPARLLAAELG